MNRKRCFFSLAWVAAAGLASPSLAQQKLGPEFQVNTYTSGFQFEPAVATNAIGDFVVVWDDRGGHDGSAGVFGQRYDGSGNRLGGEFQVNTYTTNTQGNA